MSGISTHILDTSRGRPAVAVAVTLHRLDDTTWTRLAEALTDSDGRIRPLLPAAEVRPGTHRLTFATAPYFAALSTPTLYPEITITFTVFPGETSYHIPLLLSPFGYSTYRGT